MVDIAGVNITFVRCSGLSDSYWNSGSGLYYTATYNVNGKAISFKMNFIEANSSLYASSIVQRTYKLKIISNDNVIIISFGDYNSASVSQYANIIIIYMDKKYISYATTTALNTILDNVIYNLDTSDTQGYRFINQYNFSMDNQQTKIEKTKPLLLNADNTFVANIDGLYDCSTIPQGNILTIGDKQYYSINAHTLVPV